MPWKQIRECGSLYVNSDLEDGRGIRKTKRLLQEIVILFAKEVKKYHNLVEEFPFNYNERQIHSILFPAIQKTGSVVFLEQPIKRKYRGQNPKYGWIDYWARKENTTYLIEVKHSMYSLRSRNLDQTTRTRWKEGIDQINSIPVSEAKELGLDNSEIFLITMMILPFWKGSSDKKKLVPSEKEEVLAVFSDEIMAKLNPKPNWGAVWYLHDELQEPKDFSNWYELYPAVSIQCLIKKIK